VILAMRTLYEWHIPLLFCLLMLFIWQVRAEEPLLTHDEAFENISSKAFWLWFESYGDSTGQVFDPLDSEELRLLQQRDDVSTHRTQINANKPFDEKTKGHTPNANGKVQISGVRE